MESREQHREIHDWVGTFYGEGQGQSKVEEKWEVWEKLTGRKRNMELLTIASIIRLTCHKALFKQPDTMKRMGYNALVREPGWDMLI